MNSNKGRNEDEVLDEALRNVLSRLSKREAADDCPDPETIAAWTDRSLGTHEMARVESHLSVCTRCQDIVATLALTQPGHADTAPLWQRWHLRWLVPAAAAATALAIWVAAPEDRRTATLQDSRNASSALTVPAAPPSSAAQDSLGVAPGGRQNVARRDADTPRDPAQPEKENLVEAASGRLESDKAGIGPSGRPEPESAKTESVAVESRALKSTVDQVAPSRAAQGTAAAPAATAASAQAPSQDRSPALREQTMARVTQAIEVESQGSSNRWRIFPGGRVERSTTAGTSWEPAAVEAPVELIAGSSPGPLVCWLVGRGGAVRLTVDGVRFQILQSPQAVDLTAVRASSATTAVVTASDGRHFRTDNQGKSWILVP